MKLISVTRKHIKEGRRCAGDSCPVSLALQKQLNRDDVHVSSTDVVIGEFGRKKEVIPLSKSVQEFINRFDNEKPVKPFKFKLNID